MARIDQISSWRCTTKNKCWSNVCGCYFHLILSMSRQKYSKLRKHIMIAWNEFQFGWLKFFINARERARTRVYERIQTARVLFINECARIGCNERVIASAVTIVPKWSKWIKLKLFVTWFFHLLRFRWVQMRWPLHFYHFTIAEWFNFFVSSFFLSSPSSVRDCIRVTSLMQSNHQTHQTRERIIIALEFVF